MTRLLLRLSDYLELCGIGVLHAPLLMILISEMFLAIDCARSLSRQLDQIVEETSRASRGRRSGIFEFIQFAYYDQLAANH